MTTSDRHVSMGADGFLRFNSSAPFIRHQGEEREFVAYFESISQVVANLVDLLEARGIDARFLNFGGPGDPPTRKPTVPTDARSEFLANRAMGDWAENILAEAIRQAHPQWTVAQYGNAERIAAGEPGFKEFYLRVMEEVRRYGKRPDLLVFDLGVSTADLTTLTFEQVDPLVPRALAAVEVRSSKFEALRYMRVRQQDKENGAAAARDTPSFTVKVEDLRIVYRWLERYRVPQSYCQVFFDVVYGINFLDIFQIIASGHGFQMYSSGQLRLPIDVRGGHAASVTNGGAYAAQGESRPSEREVLATHAWGAGAERAVDQRLVPRTRCE